MPRTEYAGLPLVRELLAKVPWRAFSWPESSWLEKELWRTDCRTFVYNKKFILSGCEPQLEGGDDGEDR